MNYVLLGGPFDGEKNDTGEIEESPNRKVIPVWHTAEDQSLKLSGYAVYYFKREGVLEYSHTSKTLVEAVLGKK